MTFLLVNCVENPFCLSSIAIGNFLESRDTLPGCLYFPCMGVRAIAYPALFYYGNW
ncbi:MAG: hypothetical protein KME08_07900 [Aphanothece sp. CMT-3BRIN-NPC111]|nr:hypothetical protein [Aphanothece sp. CMT-3BRIN-NPC111]